MTASRPNDARDCRRRVRGTRGQSGCASTLRRCHRAHWASRVHYDAEHVRRIGTGGPWPGSVDESQNRYDTVRTCRSSSCGVRQAGTWASWGQKRTMEEWMSENFRRSTGQPPTSAVSLSPRCAHLTYRQKAAAVRKAANAQAGIADLGAEWLV